jgi:hypothetical protein
MESIKEKWNVRFWKTVAIISVTNNTIANKFADTDFEVEYKSFILGAKEIVKRIPKNSLFKISEAGDGGREEHFLKEGEVQNIHNVLLHWINLQTDYQYHWWRQKHNSNSVWRKFYAHSW